MPLRIRVKHNAEAWVTKVTGQREQVGQAATAALRDLAAESVQEGRANIAGAGRFGPKWISGLQYRVVNPNERSAKAVIFHKFGIAGVFEHGATIEGKPLLWIPTDPRAPPAGRSGKKLVSATIHGQPVLFDAADRDRHRKPLYVGVKSVRIPKKFRITEIVKKNVKKFSALFLKHFRAG
jgi:uncharacterized protein DUF6441